ncbi:SET domain-containing protein [Backusella circina FSU 941]|nr:SET domain-containing protein [Backusella circina FSU 941]
MTLANFSNTGRGMMATDDIEAGEVIISVPKSFLITNESVTKLYGPTPLSAPQLLSLHLVLLSKDGQSSWKPYIDLLPMHFDTMPVKYPQLLLDHLPYSLRDDVIQQKENIHTDYLSSLKFLKKSNNAIQDMTFEEYEWAWLCVNTRCIHMTTKRDKTGSIALAPMLDFLNHTTEAKIESGFNIRTQSFEIKTLTPYKKGEQVFINYGPHDNAAILKEYGFVLSENTYNFVPLDKEVWSLYTQMESAKGLEAKKQVLEGTGYFGDYTIKSDEISFRLMNALRLLALKDGFHHGVMEWHDVVMGQTDRISLENERKSLVMLQSICEGALKEIKSEIEFLSNMTANYPDEQFHPFALYFLRKIWSEYSDIVSNNLVYLSDKLLRLD